MRAEDWRAVGLLSLLVAATGLPFIHRAYFVDDYYHVTMARGLLVHPGRPYDFRADDQGPGNIAWLPGERPRMVNPPLFHYFLAAVMRLWGDSVWKLRAASLIFAWFSVLATYFIGRRFVAHPLAAAALLAVTPAFWLTEYSLLIDGAQLAFFLGALWTFLIAHEKRSVGWVLASGLLMGFTMLVKYFGVLIVPVALLWQMLDPERRRWHAGYLVFIPAAGLLLGWGLWTRAVYGQMHLLATLPRGFQGRTPPLAYLAKILVLASFVGGSFIFVAAAARFLWARSRSSFITLTAFSAAILLLLVSARGGFPRGTALLMSVFVFSAGAFVAGVFTLPLDTSADRSAFLKAWWWIGAAELVVVMPWTAGRYLLLILPPTVWMLQLWIEERGAWRMGRWLLLATALAGSSLAYADYAEANTILSVSRELAALGGPTFPVRRFYLGDTFGGYDAALGPLGWQAAFPTTVYHPGDWVLVPHFRTSNWWQIPHPERLRPLARFEYPSRWPFRLMDVQASAGFYASCWGALPFVLSRHPLESFDLYEVQ